MATTLFEGVSDTLAFGPKSKWQLCYVVIGGVPLALNNDTWAEDRSIGNVVAQNDMESIMVSKKM